MIDYWYVVIFLALLVNALVWLYKRVDIEGSKIQNKLLYYILNTVAMVVTVGLMIGGFRGGFRHSTRPITLSNAGEYVENPNETAIVLNTPFALIRTFNKTALQKETFFSKQQLDQIYTPVHVPKVGKAFDANTGGFKT